jgi:hypothetical protein
MNVHDVIIAAGSLVFVCALMSAVLKHAYKVPRTSSIPTASVLTMFTVNYATMGLYFSMGVTAVTAVGWWTLVIRGPKG